MSVCVSTHLSQGGQVRGPDGREITQEQNSLNLGGGGEHEEAKSALSANLFGGGQDATRRF